ncbi:protein NRT1/ PTR FAMILY 5.10 [Ziziphus jujuba]|uniref:Protein NRT1/ PTR FAMILY 5.10 n=1 Tax=Ziziphus jujuba TaxID=326968 RepID=A0A6P4AK92_ZIZJJ|nr:protein NRT1/ PTR FAMILY 5.10 [Ziziphus jujuba]
MAAFRRSGCDAETPLLDDTVQDVVDYEGRPAVRSRSGGWRSAAFIIGAEVFERFACYGVRSNLINFLTGQLGQSTAAAAANVNLWSGTAWLLPMLGAFVADSFLGRYRSIIFASLVYIPALGLLALSALLSPGGFKSVLFFSSLYLIGVGQGGHKPSLQAFGADQFDGKDPEESKAKSSFFNWWYFGICTGILLAYLIVCYIQEDISWALGYGILFVGMVISLVVFWIGARTYRYTNIKQDESSPFARIGRVFIAAFRNRRFSPSAIPTEEESHKALPPQSYEQFKFLNKALIVPVGLEEDEKMHCTIDEVQDARCLLRLVPIWGTCVVFAIVFAQSSTFFTKQGATMNRELISGFEIPAASLQSFNSIAIVLFVPVYDRILVPIVSSFTRKPSGITILQRIGTGILLSILTIVVAAFVETKRLKTAQEYGLVDMPNATVPMSMWWLVPQYILLGIADVFTMVGMQEFFSEQVPTEMRSMGVSLYLSILGMGSFLSSFLISAIDQITSGFGQDSWFSSNLNRAHIDYFYWLLAGICAVGFVAYLCFARCYIYKL